MCALVTAAVAITASQASFVGQPGDLENQIATPPALLEEAGAIERAFEHCLDNLDPAMSDRELMLTVSQACRPGENFEGEYRVIICKIGVKESKGIRMMRVEIEYELRNGDFVLTKSLEIKREFEGN